MGKNILLTGTTGFIGQAVFDDLKQQSKYNVSVSLRKIDDKYKESNVFVVGDLAAGVDWSAALYDQQFVIHIAARAHIIRNDVPDPLSEYRKVNVDGSLNLAWQAAKSGVKRFIFISSIGVNGNINTRPFTEEDAPNPAELYAQSKWEAEQGLWNIQRATGMEIVIIRPPLVYGPNAPGNFGSLMRWVEKGVPLPLGAIHNRRSLVALDNLVDLIITCIDHPAAANQVFLAGDGQDLSTTQLLKSVATAMGKPSRLIPVPASWLMLAATLLGKQAMAQRLLGSLQVDISKAQTLLGWHPPVSVEEGLRRCFMDSENTRNGC
ncbi:UDP-glucose 4-epimerase [Nitrincola lacisaponensis]|uniref:UDP-glucose 4-epimerase n=1 Tax=Nitrincola lacisaponensis TaxID=267850 RepID=A0A063Y7P6_9GAMM|nr:SDR family oxidoreductase [Nitrincola lacisaponensis]KDE41145.1 UDP-glucose 4-epimerase [Nitrincola lacisaponensis]